ncbi:MAG TPA: serine carboxypeptidase, partial [Firmicutes bacterium]|nr:serine carboxypeptidase [Bacillota bacterium]
FIDAVRNTPVVDGVGLKHTLERWAIKWVLGKRPGLFDNKKTLVMSGLDRWGIAEVLGEYTNNFIFGDMMYAMKLPFQIRSLKVLENTARWLMPIICHIPFEVIYPTGKRQETVRPIFQGPFEWSEVIVGDYHYIRRYAPGDLEGKIVVTNTVMKSDEDDLRSRGVTLLITTTPEMDGRSFGTNILEAMFVAHLKEEGEDVEKLSPEQRNDRYLNLILQGNVEPRMVELAPSTEKKLPRFAFIMHPLRYEQLFLSPIFKPFQVFPKEIVEESAAKIPGFFVCKATGIKTPGGLEAEGYFYGLGATPRMMQKIPPEHFYREMRNIAKLAHKKGAGILGLGAFTSVIGDAGVSVAKGSPIAVTTGNSYTVWATLESVRIGAEKMGIDLGKSRAMVIGATGSIGKVITRMLAEQVPHIVIAAPKPERLMELARLLESEATRDGRKLLVEVATVADDHLPDVDIIVAATTAHGGIIDVMKLKPGALVCDVARPPDVSPEEAGKRDDI